MYCPNCKTEIPDNSKFCPECGANLLSDTQFSYTSYQGVSALQQPPIKKKKNKWWIAIIIVVAIFAFFIAVGNSSDDSQPTGGNGESQANISANKTDKPKGAIGDYIVTIKDSRVTKDYEGKDILIVTYSFTNNDDKSKSMLYSVSDKLFQNGVELGDVWSSYGIDNYSFDNHSKEIKPGVTLDVQIAYELNDTTTDVDVEIYDYIESSNPVTYTISL